MEKKLINRSFLYRQVAESIKTHSSMFNDADIITKVFDDSASLTETFENLINKDENHIYFLDVFEKVYSKIRYDEFKEFVFAIVSELQILDKNKEPKYKTLDQCISYLFKEISTYHDKLLKVKYVGNADARKQFGSLPQTFLSYSYSDKGLTLGLFFYFLNNGGFLYVNWMWSSANSNSSITKSELNNELGRSQQFLFLRTINSEMNLRNNGMIRQWCSWEIGNYYTKKQNEKYMTRFYDLPYKGSDLLQSFKFLNYVENGVMK